MRKKRSEKDTFKIFGKQISKRSKEILTQKFFLTLALFIIMLITYFLSVYMPKPSSLEYKENSNLDYNVYLKQNDYYNAPYLGKNMQYIASLIDYIDVNFKYNFNINQNLNYEYNYYIEADVVVFEKGTPSHVIFAKQEKLLDNVVKDEQNSNDFSINEDLKIDYAKYNDLVKSFKTEYGLTADSNLTLTLHVEANGDSGGNAYPIKSADDMKLTIPLTEQMININMNYKEVNDSGKIAEQTSKFNTNVILRYISILFAGLFVLMTMNTVRFVGRADGRRTYYQRRVDKILRDYDRVVVKLKKAINISENDEIIEVVDFEELLGISDKLCKSILFMETDEKEKGWFIIKDGNEIYRYVIEENSLTVNK